VIYAWDFPPDAIQVVPHLEGLVDVVYRVRYRLAAIDGIYQAYHKGEVVLLPPSSESFLTYKEITKEVLAQWAEEAIEDIAEIKDDLNQELVRLKSEPLTAEKELPWEVSE
jgi:hypothetical protein